MSLVLELPRELEQKLAKEAARLGLPLSEYAARVLSRKHLTGNALKTGADLVAYWQSAGLVGTRPNIQDSGKHVRKLRREAEKRVRR